MSRRNFLHLAFSAALPGCAAHQPSTFVGAGAGAASKGAPVRAVAFDLFTLFDPRGVDRRVTSVMGEGTTFAATWKTKLFEYCWLRAASGRYRDFDGLVRDSLLYAERAHRVELGPAQRADLAAAFCELAPWPDSVAVLEELRARGLRLAPLANFSPTMIERLLENGRMRQYFDFVLSTDRVRTYKPDPRAYALAPASFGLPRSQVAFAAFGGWDAAGARWFGLRSFWINRLAQPSEELTEADGVGADLRALSGLVT